MIPLKTRKLRCEPLEDRRMLSVTLRVDDSSTAAVPDGLAWDTAYVDLQSALTEAAIRNADANSANDVSAIWIAEGTYHPTTELEPGDPRSASFSLLNNVSLYGGFAGTETALTDRDFTAAHTTTLSGDLGVLDDTSDNAYTVVYCGEEITASLDGLSVTDGNADQVYDANHPERRYGSGIWNAGTLTLINSMLSGNSASGVGGGIENNSGMLTLIDSMLSGNSASSGGGIANHSGMVKLINSTFSSNSASGGGGGGIYNRSGTVTLINSTFSDNSAWNGIGGGGILSLSSGTLAIANSTFSGNEARSGGGIFSSSILNITNSTFSSNRVFECGGGIYSDGNLTLTNSTFSGNSACDGGGIYNYYSGTVTITNSTFSDNRTYDNAGYGAGGGIYNGYSGMLTITNSTLSGNWAFGRGGGIYSDGNLMLVNSTLSGNLARDGGGIYGSFDDSSVATLNNTIVAGNTGSFDGTDIYLDSGVLTGSYNLIGDGSDQPLQNGVDGNQVGTSESPIDPMLSHWTQLDSGLWGYCPLLGSPAIDAGNNALAVDSSGQPLIEDMSGNARIINATVDIGAVEGTSLYIPSQTYLVASLDDTVAEDGVLTFIEAFQAANTNQPVGDAPAGSYCEQDTIRFANTLAGTILVDDGQLALYGDLDIEGSIGEGIIFNAAGKNRVFYIHPGVLASFSEVTITGGLADIGGGIFNDSGTLTLTNSTLLDNSVSNRGGGIHNSGHLTLINSTLLGNSADFGGGIHSYGSLTLTNSTLSGNSARCGGGIYSSASSPIVTLNNTVVAGNTASSGSDISASYAMLTGSHNLIGDGSDQSLQNGVDGNLVGTFSSPIDPLLSDWTQFDNGQWGYYLLLGSPAIDAGDNALAVDSSGQPLTEDIAGNARIQNGTVDIGAYEFGAGPVFAGDANCDGRVDGSDVTILAGNWQAGVADGSPRATWSMGDFNGDGKVDGSDVTILAGNWQAGVSATVVAVSEPEPEAKPTRQFVPPVNAAFGVATVPQCESLSPRRFITPSPEAADAVLAKSLWSETDITAIAKDLAIVSAKKTNVSGGACPRVFWNR